jgi:hypothetical protein
MAWANTLTCANLDAYDVAKHPTATTDPKQDDVNASEVPWPMALTS